jgi:hypothetical protein
VGSHERSAHIERQLERLEELVQGCYVEAKCDRVSVKRAIFFGPSRRDLAKGRLQLGDGETYAPLVVLAQVLKEQPTSGAQSQLLDSEAKTLVVAKEETSVQVMARDPKPPSPSETAARNTVRGRADPASAA